jgi:hypothetical protein
MPTAKVRLITVTVGAGFAELVIVAGVPADKAPELGTG